MPVQLIPYIDVNNISQMVESLAHQIQRDLKDKVSESEKIVFIVTLKGAFLFASDLVRRIQLPMEVDFTRVSSYGKGTQSTGQVALIKDIEISLKDQHVIILDEIIDTGRTLNFLLEKYSKQHPKSLSICTLLDKPSRREVDVPVQYIGRKIEDRFVVGYGLDYQERYRELPAIYELKLS